MAVFSGHLRLQAAMRPDGRTVLASQSIRAPYHLSKPYWDADAGTLLVQVVNPTAGILEGDSLTSDIAVERDAALLVTTPSASRVFKMKYGSAECRQDFKVAKGGWLEVLPEPLVPHRGCRYRQTTTIEVASGGGLFYVDLLVAEGDASWLSALAALHGNDTWLGVSPLRKGGWSIKFVASDSIRLRETLTAVRDILAAQYAKLGCATRKL